MVLIDADKLRKDVLDLPDCYNGFSDTYDKACIVDLVDEQPTIEERKTGRWIEDAESYYKAVNDKGGGVDENTPYFTDDIACSECLSLFSVIDNNTELFDYCPNCGARMEVEHEQDD